MPTPNAFQFRGALGGLVASDEQVQSQLSSELDNTQKAIANSEAALNLKLAQKYREEGILVKLREERAKALKEEIDARLAQRTEGIKVEQEEAALAHTKSQTESQKASANLSNEQAAVVAPDAKARQASAYASAKLSIEQAKDIAKNRSLAESAFALKVREIEAGIVSDQQKNENELGRLNIMEAEVAVAQTRAKTEQERVALEQQRVQIEQARLRIEGRKEADETALNRMRAREASANAALAQAKAIAEAGGSITRTPGKGAKGSALTAIIGYADRDKVGDIAIQRVVERNEEYKSNLGDPSKQDDPKVKARYSKLLGESAIALGTYEQMVHDGIIRAVPVDELTNMLSHSLEIAYPSGEAETDAGQAQYVKKQLDAHLTQARANVRRAKDGSPEHANALRVYDGLLSLTYKTYIESNYRISPSLALEYNLARVH